MLKGNYNEKYKKDPFFFIFFSISLLNNCSDNENPISNNNDMNFKLEIISCDKINVIWDSTFYQGDTSLELNSDFIKADSLVKALQDSKLSVEEVWTPNDVFYCSVPIKKGSNIIVKLKSPDSLIYNYGFQNNDGGFPFCCISSWRHYKFINN